MTVKRRDEAGGKDVATETISNVEYPTVKLIDPTVGSTSPIGVAANPMHVQGTISSKTALTAASPTAATVGVASGTAVAANDSRKGLYLVNTHTTNRISLAFGATAVLDSGITLYPKQSFWMDEFSFTTALVAAIASGSSTNLAIQEFS